MTKKRNHPYFHAIILLSEILYWYRPSEICDEATGKRSYKKKFQSDLWQVSMGALSEKFELCKDQLREALDFLETETKVIIRHYCSIKTRTGIIPNVLYIELVPAVLMELTYPASDNGEKNQTGTCDYSSIYSENLYEVLEKTPIPTGENSITKTKNTTENNTENTEKTTTTEEMVVCCCDDSLISYVKQKFIRYDLNDKDAVLIVNAATKGTEDIDRAYEYLINYNKTINSIVPFIVSTIKNG